MQLQEYLAAHEVAVADFAACLGTSVQSVYRYLDGSRIPRRRIMRQIEEMTDGKVSADDFYRRVAADTE